jgi:hypothetical protein
MARLQKVLQSNQSILFGVVLGSPWLAWDERRAGRSPEKNEALEGGSFCKAGEFKVSMGFFGHTINMNRCIELFLILSVQFRLAQETLVAIVS